MSDHNHETGELTTVAPQAPVSERQISGEIIPAQPPLPQTPFDQVAASIAEITAEIAEHPVLKEGKNAFHGYMFARLQDVLAVVAPAMAKHGLTILQSERERGFMDRGNAIYATYDFVVMHKSGQVWPQRLQGTGVANTRTSKGTFDDKGLNKCHSAARKFFLMSLFQIPTTDDPDRGQRPSANARTPIAQPSRAPIDIEKRKVLERIPGEPWENWSRDFLLAIKGSTDLDKIEAWLDANKTVLEQLRKEMPEHHQHVMRQYNKRVLELQPGEAS